MGLEPTTTRLKVLRSTNWANVTSIWGRIRTSELLRDQCFNNSGSFDRLDTHTGDSSEIRTHEALRMCSWGTPLWPLGNTIKTIMKICHKIKCSIWDSNPWPRAHKTRALTNWANRTIVSYVGLEPTTTRLKVLRSTNWANMTSALSGTWTHDHKIKSLALCQLSYQGWW